MSRPLEEAIADRLLADAKTFCAEEGGEIHSRQIRALAKAVARYLAALERTFQERTEHLA